MAENGKSENKAPASKKNVFEKGKTRGGGAPPGPEYAEKTRFAAR